MHNLQTLFQGQALQILERQDTALQQVLDRLAQLQTHKKDAVGVRRRSSPANVARHSSCVRCTFLRNRVQALRKSSCPILTWKQRISHACLACAKISRGMSHRRQPTFRIDLLEKRLLLPGMHLSYVLRHFQTDDRVLTGTYISNNYQYLEDIIVKWHEDTVPVYVKALRCQSIPNLELRVRAFQPSRAFQPVVRVRWFDDDYGWISNPPVRTMPYAIPYTHYVESGRLELWARESYSWKLRRSQHRPGRSLLAVVGLQDVPTLANVSCVFQNGPRTLHSDFMKLTRL